MAAGDVEVYKAPADDTTAIDTVLTGNGIVVADKIVVHVIQGSAVFTVIKAA